MTRILSEHVLVLNKSWNPIDTCTVASAFGKLFCGTAKFLDTESYQLHDVYSWLDLPVWQSHRSIQTSKINLRVPEVLVLVSDTLPKRRVMQFSRRNLLRRDNHTCQYCGAKEHLTVDHVLPKTKGGRSTWTNCVMACLDCNAKKADRTPEQADMHLQVRPDIKSVYPHDPSKWTRTYEPVWSPVFRVPPHNLRESWIKFLPDVYTKSSILIA